MLSVQQILYDSFVQNEHDRLTDSDLLPVLVARLHFNLNSQTKVSRKGEIGKYRSQFNRGLLSKDKPHVCSFKYRNGKPVNRNGNELTLEQQQKICLKYGINDERLLGLLL